VGRWQVEHDPNATRRCYEQLPLGTDCTCRQCRNFDAAVGRAFPPRFVALADHLGIDVRKPVELCHWCRDTCGMHLTGGWFHFVGSIVSGEDVPPLTDANGQYHFEPFEPDLELGLTPHLSLVREVFAGLSVVQLEFQTRVPWVLSEPEPDVG
jgi:hypothetical protein